MRRNKPTLCIGREITSDELAAIVNPRLQTKSGASPLSAPDVMETSPALAVVALRGVMVVNEEDGADESRFVSINRVSRKLRDAAESESVKAIVLDIDSPGGLSDAGSRLNEAIVAAKQSKPVYAVVTGDCLSAAYWGACACSLIFAHKMAEIGSIGVSQLLVDTTGAQEQAGIVTTVVSTGPHKGEGQDGKVTQSMIAESQRIIDGINAHFMEAVAIGRNKDLQTIKQLATGSLWLAEEALSLGLIDRVMSPDAAYQEIQKMTTPIEQFEKESPQAYADLVSQIEARTRAKLAEEFAPKPASASELREAFPSKDDAGFVVDQLAANATMAQATEAYNKIATARIEALAKKAAELEQALASATAGQDGVPASIGQREPAPQATTDAADDEKTMAAKWEADAELRKTFPTARSYVLFTKQMALGNVKIFSN